MASKSNIVVLGAGKSGIGAGVLAKKNGANVLVSDFDQISQDNQKILNNYNISW